jgi:predicted short-subunit dehydrogenase-like oxidoreductase (DUF2520 family)
LRRGSLWLHTSGARGLEALEPLGSAGLRLGVLHPLCPVPDPETGVRELPGKPASLLGERGSWRLLELLARRAGMRPVRLAGATDRALYHAACALAANGMTALEDLVERILATAAGGGDAAAAHREIAVALMRAALDGVEQRGAGAALSGPVQRGDRSTIARHLGALAAAARWGLPTYRSLMEHATRLAERHGDLSPDRARAIVEQLRAAANVEDEDGGAGA